MIKCKIILYDINQKLCIEWKKQFKDIKNVVIANLPFDKVKADYVVTAGNSYGWMTGGLDLAVRNYYGQWIQDYIQKVIINNCNGRLEVGDVLIVPTKDKLKPNLVYAPTMTMPKYIYPIDVFYIFYKLIDNLDLKDKTIAIPGLGTATGGIRYSECAKQMRLAYNKYMEENNEN